MKFVKVLFTISLKKCWNYTVKKTRGKNVGSDIMRCTNPECQKTVKHPSKETRLRRLCGACRLYWRLN